MIKYRSMNKFLFKFAVVLIAVSVFSSADIFAFVSKDDVGTSAAQFLKLGIGAKSAGMGNAVVSEAIGADAVYWNPANLNYLERKEFSFSHTVWFEDISYEWLSFVLPTENSGTFGFSAQYVSYGDLERRDNTGLKDGSFSPMDMALYMSYANYIGDLFYGFNLKYIYSKIENSASAFAVDMGINYGFFISEQYASAGIAISNLGTAMKFNDEQENLPVLIKAGFSYWLNDDWTVAVDFNFPNDNDFYVNAGTEYGIALGEQSAMFFRAGIDGRNKDVPGFNLLTLGFGLSFAACNVDYAFVPYGDIGTTHRISLGIKFGKEVLR